MAVARGLSPAGRLAVPLALLAAGVLLVHALLLSWLGRALPGPSALKAMPEAMFTRLLAPVPVPEEASLPAPRPVPVAAAPRAARPASAASATSSSVTPYMRDGSSGRSNAALSLQHAQQARPCQLVGPERPVCRAAHFVEPMRMRRRLQVQAPR